MERILWNKVRNSNLGIKLRRQTPFVFGIYRYIADFCCIGRKIIIELDGGIHNNKEIKENDKFRESIFKEMNYRVLRFKNEEVYNNLDEVINKIKQLIK